MRRRRRSASVPTGDGYVEERFSGRSAAAACAAASDNRGESRATTFRSRRPALSSLYYVRFLSSFALLPRARRNAGPFGFVFSLGSVTDRSTLIAFFSFFRFDVFCHRIFDAHVVVTIVTIVSFAPVTVSVLPSIARIVVVRVVRIVTVCRSAVCCWFFFFLVSY